MLPVLLNKALLEHTCVVCSLTHCLCFVHNSSQDHVTTEPEVLAVWFFTGCKDKSVLVVHAPALGERGREGKQSCTPQPVLSLKLCAPVLVSHSCNPSSWEVDTRGPEIQGRAQLQSKVGASLGYARPSQKQNSTFSKAKWKQ